MYAVINHKSKAAMRRMIKEKGHAGRAMAVGLESDPPMNGVVSLCGPHYPKCHSWYGDATLKDGVIVAIK